MCNDDYYEIPLMIRQLLVVYLSQLVVDELTVVDDHDKAFAAVPIQKPVIDSIR